VAHVPDDLTDERVRRHMEGVAGSVAATAPEREARAGQRTLLVQFYTAEACARALRCSKAVCDNRFIFVKRATANVADPATLPPAPPGGGGPTGDLGSGGKGGKGKGSGKGGKGKSGGKGGAGGEGGEGGLPMDAAAAEAAAATAARLAAAELLSGDEQLKLKQERAAALKASQEALRAQTRATWQRQLADARKMKAALAKQAAKVASLPASAAAGAGGGGSGSHAAASKAAAMVALVEAKIAQLELQLAQGPSELDHQVAARAAAAAASAAAAGAGAAADGWAGAASPPPAKRANIDNRPTAFTVAAVPADCDAPQLEAHFGAFGDLLRVDVVAAPGEAGQADRLPSAVVWFAQRFSAESAFKRARSLGGVPLQFAWLTAAAAATASPAPASSLSPGGGGPGSISSSAD
jgi:hypothetical protein